MNVHGRADLKVRPYVLNELRRPAKVRPYVLPTVVRPIRVVVLALMVFVMAPGAFAQGAADAPVVKAAKPEKAAKAPKAPKTVAGTTIALPSDNYDELFQSYLREARAAPTAVTPDSLWMAGLLGDLRARHVNDLVTIHVVESVSAQGSADSNLTKNSSASAAVPSLFGIESKFPGFLDPTALASLATDTKFAGAGKTARTGVLTAVLTARVAEVLPNGDLGVEGVREIDINGDRQILVLTGVIRPSDVGPGNVVASTAVGQMRVRYFGRGLIKDNLSPGLLVRILNKIF